MTDIEIAKQMVSDMSHTLSERCECCVIIAVVSLADGENSELVCYTKGGHYHCLGALHGAIKVHTALGEKE